ncbi:MAG: tyrosine-type recombinase/integrase, partial [Candidatus Paceibacterota bacterium]
SRKGKNKPISTVQAWRIIKNACEAVGLYENVATHSLRKTFCANVYKTSGNDIVATQYLMGHKDPITTLHYLAQNQEKLDEFVLNQ